MLERLGLADRAGDLVEKLSGGLRRRVELAKGMLHRPAAAAARRAEHRARSRRPQRSVGLSRAAFASEDGVTVVLTTHLLGRSRAGRPHGHSERGQLVALDTPDALRADRRRRLDHDPDRRSGRAGRGNRAALRLRGQRARRPACGSNSPTATLDRAAGRGVSRPRSTRSRSASRRLEDVFIAAHGPSLLANRGRGRAAMSDRRISPPAQPR